MVGRLIQRGLFVVNDVKEDYEFWLGGRTQRLAEEIEFHYARATGSSPNLISIIRGVVP
jgi:hypothetical protein